MNVKGLKLDLKQCFDKIQISISLYWVTKIGKVMFPTFFNHYKTKAQ